MKNIPLIVALTALIAIIAPEAITLLASFFGAIAIILAAAFALINLTAWLDNRNQTAKIEKAYKRREAKKNRKLSTIPS